MNYNFSFSAWSINNLSISFLFIKFIELGLHFGWCVFVIKTASTPLLLQVFHKEGFEPVFPPFPGYTNLNSRGQVINENNNNGQSDKLVPKSNGYGFDASAVEFKEYTFTVDRLPGFRNYRIKLIMTSNNQVYVPRMKDLRVIALA